MARNTLAEIKQIWEPPESMDADITTISEIANRFVNSRIQGKECSSGMAITEAEMKDVELFLTGYYLSTRKKPTVSANVLNVSQTREGAFAFTGMMGNHYGQMAIELDCTGTLRDIVARSNAAAQGDVDEQAPSQFSLVSDADQELLT